MKIAGVQMDVQLGQPQVNTNRMIQFMSQAAAQAAQLVIFPECSLTGYCYSSREEAAEFAEPMGGFHQQQLIQACRQENVFCIVGLLERDGNQLFNTAMLLGPDGVVGRYRKIHLPYLGIDRFTDYGNFPFEVSEIPGLKLGMNICYDAAFPESSRILALAGADLIALPTNWPPGAECMTPAVVCTRALENKVYYAAVNRVGIERGTTFIGRSCIYGPDGSMLDSAGPDEEKILFAEIDLEKCRTKRVIRELDVHEIDRFADRRPECYGDLVQAHNLITPRQRLGS